MSRLFSVLFFASALSLSSSGTAKTEEDTSQKLSRLRAQVCAKSSAKPAKRKSDTQAEGACLDCDLAEMTLRKNQEDIAKLQGQVQSLEQKQREVAFLEFLSASGLLIQDDVNPESTEGKIQSLTAAYEELKYSIQIVEESKPMLETLKTIETLRSIRSKINKTPPVPLSTTDLQVLKKIQKEYEKPYLETISTRTTQIASRQAQIKKLEASSNPEKEFSIENLQYEIRFFEEEVAVARAKKKELEADGEWLKKGAKPPIPENSMLFSRADEYDEEHIAIYRDQYKSDQATAQNAQVRMKQIAAEIQALRKAAPSEPVSVRHKRLESLLEGSVQTVISLQGPDHAFQSCGLSWAEIYAIYFYTGEGYMLVNKALRTPEKEDDKQVKGFVDTLNAALKKLRPVTDKVQRGGQLPDDLLRSAAIGKVITLKGFTSASVTSGFESTHKFVIISKNGRYIAPFSQMPEEQEVLFPDNQRFKVLSRKEDSGSIEFVLQQVD